LPTARAVNLPTLKPLALRAEIPIVEVHVRRLATGVDPYRVTMKVTTLACLIVGKNGGLAVELLEPPVPTELRIAAVPPGVEHEERVFRRTAEGAVPVYEEI
jgi:hypothetical protein